VLRQPVLAWIGVEPALRGGCSVGGHEFRSPDSYCLSLLFVIASQRVARMRARLARNDGI